jgi:transmembrane sensor
MSDTPDTPDTPEAAGGIADDRGPDASDAPDALGPDAFEDMPPHDALRRYASGVSSEREMRSIAAWAASAPQRREYLAVLKRTARLIARELSEQGRAETDAAWAALRGKLEIPTTAIREVAPPEELAGSVASLREHRRLRMVHGRFGAPGTGTAARLVGAAAAAGLIIAAFGIYELRQDPSREPSAAPPVRTVATAAGQRAEITLNDGTTVTLGMKSQLRFPSDFGVGSREIELQGQAFFVVAHDSTHPFVVRTAGSRIVDIGTAFVVRAYQESEQVQVVVTDGAVTLQAGSAATDATLLVKGQMGRLVRGSAVPTVHAVDVSTYTAWLENRLSFENTPLPEVAAELARWHNVEVRLGDPSLSRETFTATFTAESFAETLRALTTVLGLRAERTNGTVVLYRRPQ